MRRKSKASKQRDVIRQSPHRTTGGHTFPDLSDQPICRESDLERKAILLLACCHDIAAMSSQQTIDYVDPEGVSHKYTPDLRITIGNTTRYIEVKPLGRLLAPDKQPHYAMIFRAMAQTGQQLDFITDDQVDQDPHRESADLLKRYRSHPLQDVALIGLRKALANAPTTIRSIFAKHRLPITLADIYAAIAQRHVWIDWSEPLSTDSTIALPNSGFGGLTYEDVLYSGRYGCVLQQLVLGGGTEAKRVVEATRARHKRIPDSSPLGFF